LVGSKVTVTVTAAGVVGWPANSKLGPLERKSPKSGKIISLGEPVGE